MQMGYAGADLDGIVSFHGSLPPATPDARAAVVSQFGAGEVPISISSDPAVTSSIVHTVRAVALANGMLRIPRVYTPGRGCRSGRFVLC